MTDFHLEQLGTRAFEQMAVSLASAVFGADIEIYGSGRDRGREAAWEGRYSGSLVWGGASNTVWNGYTVLQAKQQEHLGKPVDNLGWLKSQIRGELNDWMTSTRRGRFPNYLLFVTNSRLSADSGVDDINDFTRKLLNKNFGASEEHPDSPATRGLRDIAVWHRDKVNALLANHQGVRLAYPAILTLGDVLARLEALRRWPDPSSLQPFLIEQVQTALRDERWVRFSEASETTSKQYIDRVVIDLPVKTPHGTSDARGSEQALATCLRRGDRVLRHSHWKMSAPRHMVITGAPGNGKSTLTAFLAQVYRATFLAGETDNPRHAADAMTGVQAALTRLGLPTPKCLRWPVRVDLADMATQIGSIPENGVSLRRYICNTLSRRLSLDLKPNMLSSWMKAWPTAVLFDGLDEVANTTMRQRVLEEIEAFVQDADQEDWDMFVVMTTRPTGYTERFLPDHFEQVDLDYLTVDAALAYAKRVTGLRLEDDRAQAESVLTRFHEATAGDDSMARLVRTPLQILMLTFIIEQSGASLPSSRFRLFDDYYRAVFRREAAKNTSLKSFYQDFGEVVDDLHERVGLSLQVKCEAQDHGNARLPMQTVQDLARDRLVEIGKDDERELDHLVESLTHVATSRLVLLVGDEDNTVSFEVRSLQELMAARALTTGSSEVVSRNLTLTAASPHWRNTWLLAAGRLFANDDTSRDLVTSLVEGIDDSDWPGWLYPIGPELASSLLADGMAAHKPKWLRRLAHVSLRVLNGPMPVDVEVAASGLSNAGQQDSAALKSIRSAFTNAFAGTPMARTIAATVLHHADLTHVPGQPNNLVSIATYWDGTGGRVPGRGVPIAGLLTAHLDEVSGAADAHSEALVRAGIAACQHLKLRETEADGLVPESSPPTSALTELQPLLADASAVELLQLCLDALLPDYWAARSMLGQAYFRAASPLGVGGSLPHEYLGHLDRDRSVG